MSGSRPTHAFRFWASSPDELLDTTKCPACFTPLRTLVCSRCGLDLGVDGADELLAASRAVVGWEEQRQRIIAGMRERQRAAVAARTGAAAVSAPLAAPLSPSDLQGPPAEATPRQTTPLPAPAAAPAASSVAAPFAATPPPAAAPAFTTAPPAAPPRRRPTVQAVLLTTGVIAVSVTAVFFLLVAYLLASLEVRSAIIAAASLLVIGVAIVLRRRGLRATAEGVAVIALVLLLLDVWIIRANDLFGTGGVDPYLHAGAGVAVIAGLALLSRRAAPLRTVTLFAAGALPAAVALITAGAIDGPASTRVWAGAAAAVAALAGSRVTRAAIEHNLLVGGTLLGALVAGVAAWIALPDLAITRLLTFAVVALLWAGESIIARAAGPRDRWRTVVAGAGLGYAFAGAAIGGLSVGTDALLTLLEVSAVGAGVVAALVLVRAGVPLASKPQATAAVIGGLVVSALGLLVAAGSAVSAGAVALTRPLFSGLFAGGSPIGPDDGLLFALTVTTTVAVLLAALRRRTVWTVVAIEIAAGAALVLPAALAPGAGSAVAAALIAAAAGAGMLVLGGSRRWLRFALYPVGAAALLFLAAAAFTDRGAWPWASGAAVVILAGTAFATRIPAERTVLLGVGLIALVGTAASTPEWARIDLHASLLPAFVGAAALLIVAALPRLRRPDAGVLAAVSAVTLTVTGPLAIVTGGEQADLIGAGLAGIVAVASAATLASPTARRRAPEAVVAALVGPLAVMATAGQIAAVLRLDGAVVWAVSSAVVTSALAVPPAIRRATGSSPWLTGGNLAAALLPVVVVLATGSDWTWLVLVLAAVAVGISSTTDGDPVRATGARRHLGWLAAALASGALWWSLADGGVREVEPYTLPVTGLLLIITGAITARRASEHGAGRSLLFAAALALAFLPSVLASFDTGGVRAVVVAVAGGVLALAAPFLPERLRTLALRGIVLAFALSSLLLVAADRAFDEATGRGSLLVEAWLLPAVAVSGVVGLLWFERGLLPRNVATTALTASIVLLAGIETVAVIEGGFVVPRLVGTLSLLGAAWIVQNALQSERPSRLVRGATITGLGVVTATGIALSGLLPTAVVPGAGSVPAVELATVPTALALLAGGALLLERRADLGSGTALGPGLALLLVPSLLLDFWPTELWRAVALGVVALAVLLVGVVGRLRAPLLVGAATFAIHALAQLWPWLSDVYDAVPWWLWVGVGGVVLIVIAARYEQRVKNLKDAVLYLGALR
ncbi:SCO7613 C-terminal domain-containing membrane protein [Herbiconiux sp. L3-i23]|uniref:SCO7613 C-terminal domain-containing membrane protein n=1 Tax=Herbiconiux sp. L3-i23 TaxID=2905871 RepID=UPI0020632548|nr:hypothetical protein [Herbiconiux sp. L3-i23]BDI23208.1 hypothetical protein L3i23_19840 [Herbiconiux sp. L3-i23]